MIFYLVSSNIVQSEHRELVLEIILTADSEVVAGEVLGNLQDSVSPVVGSLHILDVVHVIVGNNKRFLDNTC